MQDHPPRITRRSALATAAAASLGMALPRRGTATEPPWQNAVLRYLETHARDDDGYAWEDQEQSHLTPSFAAIGCYYLLKQSPPRKLRLAEFVRTHHPSRLKKLEQEHRIFDFQQVQALTWLGEDVAAFRPAVRAWTAPLIYLKQYERHGYPVFQSEASVFACRALLKLPPEELTPRLTDYLLARRRGNGSFNNTPAADGSDGHMLNTFWGLQALRTLGRQQELRDETVAWLRACQLPGGGFTWQPKPPFAGVDDVAYTRAAVRGLATLGAAPARRDTCVAYLLSLANADGGFGDRPGWLSNPLATLYALDALDALGALGELKPVGRPFQAVTKKPEGQDGLERPSYEGLNVFSIQIEAHGCGSPAEAVDLARGLKIQLWGAKNAKPAWLARAQAIADRDRVPVRFFTANEEYGTWVDVPGLGTYSHTSDVIAPADSPIGPSLAGQGAHSWPEFCRRRLAPLVAGGGRLVWQFGENEELVRLYLDDSLLRGGYAAISTFHFGNPDFTNSEPFLHRWRGQLPFVALQDAHGSEPWWFADMTTGFRTLFLAAGPTWDGWLEALRKNWVVAVRHDAASGQKTWMHAGSRAVLDFVRTREDAWRWWDNPAIARPLVSIVPVFPQDEFETARPQQGVTVRVRCAWENTPQGLLRQPNTELVKLVVDGVEVKPALASIKAAKGALLADHYHHHHIAAPAAGKHAATAVVRHIETKTESSRTVEFVV